MLRRIIGHEWRLMGADRTLLVLALGIVVLVGYALVNGAGWTGTQSTAVQIVVAADQARMESLRNILLEMEAGRAEAPSAFNDPSLPAPVGRSLGVRAVVLPPGPLAATAVGQSDLFPSYAVVSTASGDPFLRTPGLENPLHLLAGRFDLAFVIVFLLPLLVLGIGYGMISREREDGTLSLVMTQPVPVSGIVWGKVLARGLPVLGLVGGLTMVGLLTVGVRPGEPGAALGLLLWFAVVAAYLAFWLVLAALVNLLGRSSSENAMILATAWLALAILVPAGLNVTATMLYPVPSRAEMIGAEREAAREAQEEGAQILAAYYQEHPELAGEAPDMENFAARSWAVQEEVEERIRPVRERYDLQAARQRDLLRSFRFLSPALVAQEALQDVAGTGEPRYRAFREQVATAQRDFRDFIGSRIVRGERFNSADVDRLPGPGEFPAAAGLSPAALGVNLLGLLLPTLLLGVLVQRRSGRLRRQGGG